MPNEMYDLLIEEKITIYLMMMKIYPNVKGFRFLLDGAKIIVNDTNKKKNVNNVLYNDIAYCYNTDRVAIDGALRHAIDISAKRGGFKTFSKDFDFIIKGSRPTPRELLSAIVIKLKKDKHFNF